MAAPTVYGKTSVTVHYDGILVHQAAVKQLDLFGLPGAKHPTPVFEWQQLPEETWVDVCGGSGFFGQRDKLRADRSKRGVRSGRKEEAAQRGI
jgi:hypothetical protein